MHYGSPPARPGIVSTLGLLLVGMAACAAWAWSTAPDHVSALAGRLTGSDYVLLAVFLIVGLASASVLASMAQALLQALMHIAQVALLVGVAIAGVVLWRSYGPNAHASNGMASETLVSAPDAPLVAPAAVDLEEQRRALEAKLLELDTRDGSAWWQHD